MGGSQLTARRLNAKRQAFVAEYLRCWNASEAARRAGYRHPMQYGSYLINLEVVAQEIRARLAEKAMSADEVLTRLAEQARAEYAQYLTDDGKIDLQAVIDDGKAHLIKSMKRDRGGNLVVEFYDAQAALALIGRHLKLFTDNVNHSGAVGGVIAVLPAIEEPDGPAASGGGDGGDVAPA
ncbi:MAG: terminase small subunit [Chloroflexi bacterium]|nr:terminase small subunit [Chloroflexota bacterium]